jgi:formate dehydrogenase major subunit
MIRERDRWRRTSWSEARAFVAERLQALIDQHGADTIGVLGSARATNEDNHVIQKFARTVIGTNNVDCCARVCHAPSAAAPKRVLGSGLTTNSFDDIERARTILVCGTNATEDHPVVGTRIRQAARRGAQLIVIDPRPIELTADARCHLALKPTIVALGIDDADAVALENRLFAEQASDTRLAGSGLARNHDGSTADGKADLFAVVLVTEHELPPAICRADSRGCCATRLM